MQLRRQRWLKIAHRFEAQVPDQSADEARQPRPRDRFKSPQLRLQEAGGIRLRVQPHDMVCIRFNDLHLVPPQDILCPRRHPDERVARDPFSSFDGFQQERSPVPAQL